MSICTQCVNRIHKSTCRAFCNAYSREQDKAVQKGLYQQTQDCVLKALKKKGR